MASVASLEEFGPTTDLRALRRVEDDGYALARDLARGVDADA